MGLGARREEGGLVDTGLEGVVSGQDGGVTCVGELVHGLLKMNVRAI